MTGAGCILGTGTPSNAQAFNVIIGYSASGIIGVMGYAYDFYPFIGTRVDDGAWQYYL